MTESLCRCCHHRREIISGKGSRFFLCRLALEDPRFAKYPQQPVIHCAGFAAEKQEGKSAANRIDAEE